MGENNDKKLQEFLEFHVITIIPILALDAVRLRVLKEYKSIKPKSKQTNKAKKRRTEKYQTNKNPTTFVTFPGNHTLLIIQTERKEREKKMKNINKHKHTHTKPDQTTHKKKKYP